LLKTLFLDRSPKLNNVSHHMSRNNMLRHDMAIVYVPHSSGAESNI